MINLTHMISIFNSVFTIVFYTTRWTKLDIACISLSLMPLFLPSAPPPPVTWPRKIREKKQILTLIFYSNYHIMNNTCIDMRALDLNICIYKKGKYTKNPLDKGINRKANIHPITITFTNYKQQIKILQLMNVYL
jgi:hypothetical protein